MVPRSTLLLVLGLLCGVERLARGAPAQPDSTRQLPERDRIRLAEAFRLADAVQDRVWPEWSSSPFPVLLVTPETEFLVRHPAPSADFAAGPYDSLLGSRVYWRRRVFPPTFQATFPAVGGISTIVIGEAENARPKENSTRWILTLMHEHFHQWQESRPGYQAAVNRLRLAHGDSTGMWMLDFPFPYTDFTIARSFDELCRLRPRALLARGTAHFSAAYDSYDAARRSFWGLVFGDDARYLAFQLWKEGVARYTEYAVARAAAAWYAASPRYRSLEDFTPFDVEAQNVLRQILDELSSMKLAKAKRISVYPAGASDALLLDERRPNWKAAYIREGFSLEPLFPRGGR